MKPLETLRLLLRVGFFALFVLAPPLDLLRFDLTQGHAILFKRPWVIGIDDFVAGTIDAGELAFRIMSRVFLPLLAAAGLVITIAYRWGRLYCGWLCPHFSVVETINALMRRSIGKHSLWDRQRLPLQRADGRPWRTSPAWWPVTIAAALVFALLWAVVLLSYLLPPAEVYGSLLNGRLSPNQARFLIVAAVLLFIEFTLARHLFCRYGCAVGLFQSLAWMANPHALVVGFDRSRAHDCQACANACDNACPMRLHPRTVKRNMFACTQCGQCIRVCAMVQRNNADGGLLQWVSGPCALDKGERGRRQLAASGCFPGRQSSAVRAAHPR